MFLYLLCKYYIENVCIYVHKKYWSSVGYVCGLDIRVIATLREELVNVQSVAIGINTSLNIW